LGFFVAILARGISLLSKYPVPRCSNILLKMINQTTTGAWMNLKVNFTPIYAVYLLQLKPIV